MLIPPRCERRKGLPVTIPRKVDVTFVNLLAFRTLLGVDRCRITQVVLRLSVQKDAKGGFGTVVCP